jgi:hypothetical protein
MLNDYKMGAANLLTRYKKLDTTAMMVLQKSPRGTYYWCEMDKVEKTPRKTSCCTMTPGALYAGERERENHLTPLSPTINHVLYDEDNTSRKHGASSTPCASSVSHHMASQ